MAKLSFTAKSHRMVTFLLAMRNPSIFNAMGRFGMTQESLTEGWELLWDCGKVRGDRALEPDAIEPKIVAKIDAWENENFPVVDATLRRNFPEVHKRVFQNLSQTSGPAVVVGVKLFVDRILELEKASDKASKDARALLKARGITKAVVDEARMLLTEAGTPLENNGMTPAEDYALEFAAAEEAMWGWYLEWAQIARVAVKDGRHLINLFGSRRVASAPEAEEDEVSPPETNGASQVAQQGATD